jgi:hypothetical protein
LLAFNKILKKWDIIIEEGDYGFKEENTDERIHITKDVNKKWVIQLWYWLFIVTIVIYPIFIIYRVNCA